MNNKDFQNGLIVGLTKSGGGSGGSSVQPDYLQDDPAAKDYIKNRPFYGQTEEKIVEIPPSPAEINILDSTIGLVAGEKYLFFLEKPTDLHDSEAFCELQAETMSLEDAGIEGEINVIEFYEDGLQIIIYDKITIDADGNMGIGEGAIYSVIVENTRLNAPIWIKGEMGDVKKIDPVYLPAGIGGEIEVATSDKLGGVMPVQKYSQMTQQVGIDEEGRLYTYPGATYEYASTSTAGLIKTSTSYNSSKTYLPCSVNINGTLYVEAPETVTTVDSTSEALVTSKAVYDFVADILKEATY
jgi:hypothetical protein